MFVSDRIDATRHPAARMTVGFAKIGKGESMQVEFPYDEVLVVTRGMLTVRGEDGASTSVGAGGVIYLPAASVSTYHADEETELVYVASPADVYAEHVAASATG